MNRNNLDTIIMTSKKTRYSVTYGFTFRYHNKFNKALQYRTVDERFSASTIEERDELIQEYMEIALMDLSQKYDIVDVQDAKIVNVVKVGRGRPPKKIRMRNAVLTREEVQQNKIESVEGLCVIEALFKKYKPFIKKLTRKSIKALLDPPKQNDFLNDILGDEQDEYNGYTVDDICRFTERYKISHYALDYDNTLCFKAVQKSSNFQPLVYKIADEHMYLVDRVKQSKLIRKGTSDFKPKKKVKVKKDMIVIESDSFDWETLNNYQNTSIIFTNIFNLFEFFEYKLRNDIIIDINKAFFKDGKMLSLDYETNSLRVRPDYKDVVKICESLNIEYNLQSLSEMSHILYEKTAEKIQNSYFNNELSDLFDMYRKTPFNDVLKTGKSYGYDIQKCYTSCLLDNKYSWCIYSSVDVPTPYNGEKLKDGLYVVETKNYLPFRGNGLYSRELVEYAQSQNIDFKITYHIEPTRKLKADIFKTFVKSAYTLYGLKIGKNIVNFFVGSLNRLFKTGDRYQTNLDVEQAFNKIYDNDNMFINMVHYKKDESPIYIIKSSKTEKMYYNSSPIYNQIIDLSYIKLHKLTKETDAKVMGYNTDCVYFDRECPEIETDKVDFGLYRHEGEKTLTKLRTNKLNKEIYNFKLPEIKMVKKEDLKDGALMVGGAGTGKTYNINELTKVFDLEKIKYQCLAPTNKACNLLDGQTIHRFLGINRENRMTCKVKVTKYDYLIIDEVSMVGYEIFNHLAEAKRLNPELKFIFSGDIRNQLKPIEHNCRSIEYEKCYILNYLAGFNKIHLTQNYRSGGQMTKVLKKLDLEFEEEGYRCLDQFDFGDKKCRKNLVFRNVTRKKINKIFMDKLKGPRQIFNRNKKNEKSQKHHIIKGSPIIACKTLKTLDICNNEEFDVFGWDGKFVIITDVKYTNKEPKELMIPYKHFETAFLPAYAMTIHKSQGSTYKEPYRIHEIKDLDKRLLYTALSRTSDIKFVNVKK